MVIRSGGGPDDREPTTLPDSKRPGNRVTVISNLTSMEPRRVWRVAVNVTVFPSSVISLNSALAASVPIVPWSTPS